MKYVFITLGFLFCGTGCIAVFLPILPATPFLLLSAYCFARGSERFHRWFTGTNLYKKHLDSFVQNKAMTLKTKLSILLTASIMLLFAFLKTKNLYGKIIIALLAAYKYYYFFTKIRTIPPLKKKLEQNNKPAD